MIRDFRFPPKTVPARCFSTGMVYDKIEPVLSYGRNGPLCTNGITVSNVADELDFQPITSKGATSYACRIRIHVTRESLTELANHLLQIAEAL